MATNLPIIAGFMATGLFAVGTLPMLAKAFRTKDLASYSLGNILLNNVGNIVNSIYIFHLPPGPVWFLHSYNLLIAGLMLAWFVRYEGLPDRSCSSGDRATSRLLPPLCHPETV